MVEIGAPSFWASKCEFGIETIVPLKSPECGLSNGANNFILNCHFDAQNGKNLIPPVGNTSPYYTRLLLEGVNAIDSHLALFQQLLALFDL